MSVYQVQVWPRGLAWQDVEAAAEKEAAEKACGFSVQLVGAADNICARVRRKGDLTQHTATVFYKSN